MPTTETAEPALPNPVLPNDYTEAKSTFRQARIDAGLDKAAEPAPESDVVQVSEVPPPPPEPKADAVQPEKPASVLPEDIFAPKSEEEEKPSTTIAELEAMTLPKNAKAERVASFEALKKKAITDLQAAEQKVKDLESKISTSRSNTEVEKLNEKLKNAEAKAAEIEDQWAKSSLETSPRFQQQFVKREQAELESAKSYLEGSEVDPRIIDYAARTHGATRVKVLTEAGLTPELIASVNSHLAVYDGIQRDKTAAIENWRAQGTQWQEQEAQRIEAEKAKRSEQENKVWEEVLKENSNLLPYRESKDEKWNSRRSELLEKAKTIYNGNGTDLKTYGSVTLKGIAYDALMENVVTPLLDRVKLQDQQIAKLTSSAPGGTITQSTGTVAATDTSKMSREELSKQTFNEQLARAKGGP